MKVIAQGAFDSLSGYFQDPWNRLDFFLLLAGWLPQLFALEGLSRISNFSFVRAIRILRVLKTVKSVPELKRLVQAILDALPHLLSVGYVLAFIFLLFGILGTQLYSGLLRNRCFPSELLLQEEGGEAYVPSDALCSATHTPFPGTASCPSAAALCSAYYPGTRRANNNNNPFQHFDNIPTAFLTIFVIISLEGVQTEHSLSAV